MRLPAWIDHPTDPEGEPYRPTGALWVSLRTGLMHLQFHQKEADFAEAAASFSGARV